MIALLVGIFVKLAAAMVGWCILLYGVWQWAWHPGFGLHELWPYIGWDACVTLAGEGFNMACCALVAWFNKKGGSEW